MSIGKLYYKNGNSALLHFKIKLNTFLQKPQCPSGGAYGSLGAGRGGGGGGGGGNYASYNGAGGGNGGGNSAESSGGGGGYAVAGGSYNVQNSGYGLGASSGSQGSQGSSSSAGRSREKGGNGGNGGGRGRNGGGPSGPPRGSSGGGSAELSGEFPRPPTPDGPGLRSGTGTYEATTVPRIGFGAGSVGNGNGFQTEVTPASQCGCRGGRRAARRPPSLPRFSWRTVRRVGRQLQRRRRWEPVRISTGSAAGQPTG